jgi:hypothetical protein
LFQRGDQPGSGRFKSADFVKQFKFQNGSGISPKPLRFFNPLSLETRCSGKIRR